MAKKNSKHEEKDIELEETTAENAEEAAENAEEAAAETPEADESAQKLAALEEELKNEKDKYMRLFAEFDNFRKRTAKEKTEIYGDAVAKTIGELLPAIDNFNRALDTPCSDENFKKGVEMIFTQMNDIFGKLGVSEIEALGKPFNPNLHNAIKRVEDEEAEPDTICEVFQKGYKLGDRIIRHSMVSVNA
ncbi:MAG: nucleotide exchange factor GrpE [Ruminococcus sp.]|jgi:molecular chaperone GrpE|nr:nucleotide exchange factor GrpE [Ruminococcus sp.]